MEYKKESMYEFGGERFSFKYTDSPTISDKMTIVDGIVDGVINDIIGYEPILFDYFVAVSLVNNLTDITLPDSFDESAKFIQDTDILNILNYSMPKIYEELISAAQKKIDFILKKYANRSKADDLLDSITNLVNKYGSMFDGKDVDGMIEKLNSISSLASIPKDTIVKNVLEFESKKDDK